MNRAIQAHIVAKNLDKNSDLAARKLGKPEVHIGERRYAIVFAVVANTRRGKRLIKKQAVTVMFRSSQWALTLSTLLESATNIPHHMTEAEVLDVIVAKRAGSMKNCPGTSDCAGWLVHAQRPHSTPNDRPPK
jgi:hypothetical protein